MNYLFAGKEIAAERLKKLHEVFCKSSEFFVRNNARNKINVCLDLGCGSGHTTRDLVLWIDMQECIGMDNSPYFIEQAKELSKNYPQIKYKLHDVTKIPFPVKKILQSKILTRNIVYIAIKKADVIYIRFLLTHLKDPIGCIRKWESQLTPKGLILFEEIESIKTNVPVFQKYITIVERMLKSNRNLLYAGKLLDNSDYEPGFQKKYSEICNVPVSVKDAAVMFSLNIPSWRNNEFIKKNYTETEINEIEDELLKLSKPAESDNNKNNNDNNLFIEWDIRQIVLVKN